MTEELNTRTDAATAPGEDAAIWVAKDYAPDSGDLGNLEPIKAQDLVYLPGSTVTVDGEHSNYPDEEGVVKAVGVNVGTGDETYLVLIEGTDEPAQFARDELSA